MKYVLMRRAGKLRTAHEERRSACIEQTYRQHAYHVHFWWRFKIRTRWNSALDVKRGYWHALKTSINWVGLGILILDKK